MCVLDRVEGYGERSSLAGGQRRGSGDAGGSDGVGGDNDDDDNIGSAPNRDGPASQWGEVNGTMTCANCCSTLGYASDHDPVRGEPPVGVESKGSAPHLYYNPPVQYSPLLSESFLHLQLVLSR